MKLQKYLNLNLLFLLLILSFQVPLNAKDLSKDFSIFDKVVRGLEFSIGTRKNWISISYEKNSGDGTVFPTQLYDLSYEDLTLVYAKLKLFRVLTYEKVFPIGDTSKKTFAAWDNNNKYYEYDLANILLLWSFITGKPLSFGKYIYDIGIGYLYTKELYTSKLTLNLSPNYEVYYATLNADGTISVQQQLNSTTYAVLQEFYKKVYYLKIYSKGLGVKLYSTLGWGKLKTNQPITWYYENLSGKSRAVIVRAPISSEGFYYALGLNENLHLTDKLYINQLEISAFIPYKTEFLKVNGYSLTPNAFFTTDKLYLFYLAFSINFEYQFNKNYYLDLGYNPELWLLTTEDPIYGLDIFTKHIVHHLDLSFTFKF